MKTMDEKIKENCPQAWELFLYKTGLKYSWHPFDDPKWFRQLYDFFDDIGIFVEIGIDRTTKPKFAPYVYWDCLWLKDEPGENDKEYETWQDEHLYRTRADAEESGFMMAFEILETKLNEKWKKQ